MFTEYSHKQLVLGTTWLALFREQLHVALTPGAPTQDILLATLQRSGSTVRVVRELAALIATGRCRVPEGRSKGYLLKLMLDKFGFGRDMIREESL